MCIKTVEGGGKQGAAELEQQKKEVAVLAALKHPNIIRCGQQLCSHYVLVALAGLAVPAQQSR